MTTSRNQQHKQMKTNTRDSGRPVPLPVISVPSSDRKKSRVVTDNNLSETDGPKTREELLQSQSKKIKVRGRTQFWWEANQAAKDAKAKAAKVRRPRDGSRPVGGALPVRGGFYLDMSKVKQDKWGHYEYTNPRGFGAVKNPSYGKGPVVNKPERKKVRRQFWWEANQAAAEKAERNLFTDYSDLGGSFQ